jgi:alkyldihydroxyacetonephosphate synthase
MAMKWWGWGEEERSFPLSDPERFWSFLRERLGETNIRPRLQSLDQIVLPPSRLVPDALAALRRAADDSQLATDDGDRAVHSLGKGYRDLVRIRRGEVPNPSDAVIYPATDEQVAAILAVASERGIAVIPFGGGTSVVGGVEPAGGGPTVTLDLGRLERVLRIDPVSETATVEAGIMGPALQAQLNAAGFTLGHFPQSFEYSSLGGWIATRSAGQKSTLYGKIEERTQSLRLLFPGGLVDTPSVPAAAAGPDLTQTITGTEGVLGVITRATIRLSPLPALSDYRGFLLPAFADGVEAAREVMQSGLRPAVLRLSDEPETEATAVMQMGRAGVNAALLILGFDGEEDEVRLCWERGERILGRHAAQPLGQGLGEAWERSRFDLPYLRDILLDHGVMVDTLETAATWERYPGLYRSAREAMETAMAGRGVVMAHLSHAYTDGASIYYTFLARQDEGREIEQWQRVKTAATQAIIDGGGALSHHHGIGVDHRPWIGAYLGSGGVRALAALKNAFDPRGIMNPGKLTADNERTMDVQV